MKLSTSKLSVITISLFAALFLVNCSTHPEIKPYEETTFDEEASSNEELPYGQAISDSVFNDTTVAASNDDSIVPTEFDDRIDSVDEEETLAPKKEVSSQRAPASVKPSGKNGFYTFSADCVMKSGPSDTSSDVGNVSKGKKLWLDKHDGTWFKAFKKSGTVYVPSSCVQ
jgi:hypothetical protein